MIANQVGATVCLERDMAHFDRLPPALRAALNYANNDWSSEVWYRQLHTRRHGMAKPTLEGVLAKLAQKDAQLK